MKILFDTQCFDMQKFGGISRYFCGIIKNLPNNDDYILPCIYSKNEYLKQTKLVNFIESSFPGKKFFDSLKNKYFLSRILRNRQECTKALQNQDFDVFHPTYFDPYFLEYIGKKPFVLTIHDMIYELYPEFFSNADEIIKNKKLLAEKAAKIIAVSNKTKEDIVKFYGASFADKTEVVYHGSSLKMSDSAKENPDFKTRFGKYFLFTGSRNIYKNFLFMIESCAEFLIERDLKIVCSGAPFTDGEKSLFDTLNISDRIIHHFASDNELFWLYKNATAFIFPSYYEGFGIPILEAFEGETPCLLANSSCFPEIAADAALYFDPKDKNEIVSVMSQILDKNIVDHLVEKGKERLKNFSWKKTAQQTSNIYKSLLD
ncbi:glycosyltransferase family 4 protein [bacterium]|nr:glycosyltransferase family 4 protein [bacterium]